MQTLEQSLARQQTLRGDTVDGRLRLVVGGGREEGKGREGRRKEGEKKISGPCSQGLDVQRNNHRIYALRSVVERAECSNLRQVKKYFRGGNTNAGFEG